MKCTFICILLVCTCICIQNIYFGGRRVVMVGCINEEEKTGGGADGVSENFIIILTE